jgi:hypothetical protein
MRILSSLQIQADELERAVDALSAEPSALAVELSQVRRDLARAQREVEAVDGPIALRRLVLISALLAAAAVLAFLAVGGCL